jgi:hypothetical protein
MSGKRIFFILISISVVLVAVFLSILFTGDAAFRMELWKEAAKTIPQLLLIGLLGAFASFLFTEYARDKALQAAQHKSRLKALNKLTSLYWETRKAFDIIDAHRSAKSYGEQMRQIIDYRIEFQRLDNDIAAGIYAVKDGEATGKSLFDLINLLKEAIEEWEKEYLRLSRLQIQDEKQEDPAKKKVPQEIDKLPTLACLKRNDFKTLHDHFEKAARPIREQLRADLQNQP